MVDVLIHPADDYQVRLRHSRERIAEPVEEQADPLVMLEVTHIHRDWALTANCFREQGVRPLAVTGRALAGRQQGGVLHQPYRLVRGVAAGQIPESRADRQDTQAMPDRKRLAPP